MQKGRLKTPPLRNTRQQIFFSVCEYVASRDSNREGRCVEIQTGNFRAHWDPSVLPALFIPHPESAFVHSQMPRQTSQSSGSGPWSRLQQQVQDGLKWRREFYRSTEYHSVAELLDDALVNPLCQAFVTHCLGLRIRGRSRHSLDELIAQRRLGANQKLWYKPLCRSIFAMYETERSLAKQKRGEESTELRGVSRRQRQILAGSSVLRTRRATPKKLAAKRRAEVVNAWCNHGAIIWMDNFNKFRYARNVNEERDQCINGTVFAIIPLKDNMEDTWPGWQPLSVLMKKMEDVKHMILRSSAGFSNEVKTLKQNPLSFDQVRVPCDVRRLGASNFGWTPWSVNGENIGSTLGMLSSLGYAMDLQMKTGKVMPIVVDVNVYYRIVKMLYHKDLISVNIRGAFREHPLVFGLWHAYAHCVKRTFVIFKTIWAALEYPGFIKYPETTNVYLKPRVDALEQMVVAMYLIHSERTDQIRSTVRQCKADFGEGSRMHRLAQCLRLLLEDFVPCLFAIGLSVRECYWDLQKPETGARARQILAFCLTYLLSLEKSNRNEYCRVLSMALLFWTPYHSMLPAAAFVEEVLEASLSRLSRYCGTDLRTHTVEQFSDAYASLGPGPQLADCSHPHLAATLPDRVLIRLDKVLSALRAGALPEVVGTNVKGHGCRVSSSTIFVPRSPLQQLHENDIRSCMYHSMYTMLSSDDVDDAVKAKAAAIARMVPALNAHETGRIQKVQDEARHRLRNVLRRPAPGRRTATRVVDSDALAASDGDTLVGIPSGAGLSYYLCSGHCFFLPSGQEDEAGPTDPDGRSDSEGDTSSGSTSPSYHTDDSRSPACSSGDEGSNVSAISFGGLSARAYYSQV